MKRRTLLKVGLSVAAMAAVGRHAAAAGPAMPVVAAGELSLMLGSPGSGRPAALLEWAYCRCGRTGQTVVLSSSWERDGHLRQWIDVVDDPAAFMTDATFWDLFEQGQAPSPCVVWHTSTPMRVARPFQSATWLVEAGPRGCAAVVLDGWAMSGEPAAAMRLLEAAAQARGFAASTGVPVVMGVTRGDAEAREDWTWVERALVEEAHTVVRSTA